MARLLAACIVCALGLLLLARRAGDLSAHGSDDCWCAAHDDRDWLEPWRDPYTDRLEDVRDALGRLR